METQKVVSIPEKTSGSDLNNPNDLTHVYIFKEGTGRSNDILDTTLLYQKGYVGT